MKEAVKWAKDWGDNAVMMQIGNTFGSEDTEKMLTRLGGKKLGTNYRVTL